MQRLFNLDKWTEVPEGKAIRFGIERPRIVRIDVNAAGQADLFVILDDTGPKFLARVEGRDVVEFSVSGAFAICANGAPVSLYTVDGELWNYVEHAPEIFTKIHERRTQSPELQYMMRMMQLNMEKRLATQRDELVRALARREPAAARSPEPAGAAAASRGKPKGAARSAAGGGGEAPVPRAGRDDEV